jgi:hypothetical protein
MLTLLDVAFRAIMEMRDSLDRVESAEDAEIWAQQFTEKLVRPNRCSL